MKLIKNLLLWCCLIAAPFALNAKVLTTAQAQKNLYDAVAALKKDPTNASLAQNVLNNYAAIQGPQIKAAADAKLKNELGKNITQVKALAVAGDKAAVKKSTPSITDADATTQGEVQSYIDNAEFMLKFLKDQAAVNAETDAAALSNYNAALQQIIADLPTQKAKKQLTSDLANLKKRLDAQSAAVAARIADLSKAPALPPVPSDAVPTTSLPPLPTDVVQPAHEEEPATQPSPVLAPAAPKQEDYNAYLLLKNAELLTRQFGGRASLKDSTVNGLKIAKDSLSKLEAAAKSTELDAARIRALQEQVSNLKEAIARAETVAAAAPAQPAAPAAPVSPDVTAVIAYDTELAELLEKYEKKTTKEIRTLQETKIGIDYSRFAEFTSQFNHMQSAFNYIKEQAEKFITLYKKFETIKKLPGYMTVDESRRKSVEGYAQKAGQVILTAAQAMSHAVEEQMFGVLYLTNRIERMSANVSSWGEWFEQNISGTLRGLATGSNTNTPLPSKDLVDAQALIKTLQNQIETNKATIATTFGQKLDSYLGDSPAMRKYDSSTTEINNALAKTAATGIPAAPPLPTQPAGLDSQTLSKARSLIASAAQLKASDKEAQISGEIKQLQDCNKDLDDLASRNVMGAADLSKKIVDEIDRLNTLLKQQAQAALTAPTLSPAEAAAAFGVPVAPARPATAQELQVASNNLDAIEKQVETIRQEIMNAAVSEKANTALKLNKWMGILNTQIFAKHENDAKSPELNAILARAKTLKAKIEGIIEKPGTLVSATAPTPPAPPAPPAPAAPAAPAAGSTASKFDFSKLTDSTTVEAEINKLLKAGEVPADKATALKAHIDTLIAAQDAAGQTIKVSALRSLKGLLD